MTVFEKQLKHIDVDQDYNRACFGIKEYVFQLLLIKCDNTLIKMCKFTKH